MSGCASVATCSLHETECAAGSAWRGGVFARGGLEGHRLLGHRRGSLERAERVRRAPPRSSGTEARLTQHAASAEARPSGSWVSVAVTTGVLGLLWLVVLVGATRLKQVDYDDGIYLSIAEQIVQTGLPIRPVGAGQVFNDHPPLGPYLLALPVALFGKAQLPIRALAFVMFYLPLLGAVVYAARRYLTGWAWLYAALLLTTFYPFLTASPTHLDMPLTVLVFGAGLALWGTLEPLLARARPGVAPHPAPRHAGARRREIGAAVLFVLALLTKAPALLLVGGLALYTGLEDVVCRERPWRTWQNFLRQRWLLLGVVLGLVATWAASMLVLRHDYWARYVRQFERFFGEATSEPMLPFLGTVARAVSVPLLVLWLALAAYALASARRSTRFERYMACLGVFFLTVLSTLNEKRVPYLFPAFPFLIVWSAGVLARLQDELGQRARSWSSSRVRALRSLAPALVGSVIVGQGLALGAFFAARRDVLSDNEDARLGAFIRQVSAPGDRVLLRHLEIAYFADRNAWPIHYQRIDALRAILGSGPEPHADLVMLGRDNFRSTISASERREVLDTLERDYEPVPGAAGLGIQLLKRRRGTDDGTGRLPVAHEGGANPAALERVEVADRK